MESKSCDMKITVENSMDVNQKFTCLYTLSENTLRTSGKIKDLIVSAAQKLKDQVSSYHSTYFL